MIDRRRVAALVAVAIVAIAACAGSTDESAGCGRPVREALDPQSGVHLLDPDAITYLSDPPTSGPHVARLPPDGALTEPLPRPLQVALLEAGGIVVQYGPLDEFDRVAVEAVARDLVAVAPSDSLEAGEIVATAWLYKLSCRTVDVEALQAFVDDRLGRFAGHS